MLSYNPGRLEKDEKFSRALINEFVNRSFGMLYAAIEEIRKIFDSIACMYSVPEIGGQGFLATEVFRGRNVKAVTPFDIVPPACCSMLCLEDRMHLQEKWCSRFL